MFSLMADVPPLEVAPGRGYRVPYCNLKVAIFFSLSLNFSGEDLLLLELTAELFYTNIIISQSWLVRMMDRSFFRESVKDCNISLTSNACD